MRASVTARVTATVGALLLLVLTVGVFLRYGEFSAILNLIDADTQGLLSRTLFSVGGRPVRVFFLLKTFLFLVFLNVVTRVASSLLRRLAQRNPQMGANRQHILSRFSSFAIYVIGVLIWIHVERITPSSLVILGGTLGVGLGIGMQPLVSNLISGIVLLLEQPIRIGDRIELADKTGEVVHVGGRSSWIRTYDNAILIIPNTEFVTKQVLNWTLSDPTIRVTVTVSVAPQSNPTAVQEILLSVARAHADVIADPQPNVIISELGLQAITFALRIWTLTRANSASELKSEMYVQILERFREDRVELSAPQLHLHVKSLETPIAVSVER